MTDGQPAPQQSIDKSLHAVLAEAGGVPRPAGGRPGRSAPLDVAIPIYNNAGLLGKCLETLLPTLSPGDAVWLIDDASDDPGVASRMEAFSRGLRRALGRVRVWLRERACALLPLRQSCGGIRSDLGNPAR